MSLKYVVYHWEEFGGPESGPLGLERTEDGAFDTEGDAQAWISQQAKPHWYDIMEVTDYPSDDELPPWMRDDYLEEDEADDCS